MSLKNIKIFRMNINGQKIDTHLGYKTDYIYNGIKYKYPITKIGNSINKLEHIIIAGSTLN
jgi:hypothetical protein